MAKSNGLYKSRRMKSMKSEQEIIDEGKKEIISIVSAYGAVADALRDLRLDQLLFISVFSDKIKWWVVLRSDYLKHRSRDDAFRDRMMMHDEDCPGLHCVLFANMVRKEAVMVTLMKEDILE